jgi:hypothetical protein
LILSCNTLLITSGAYIDGELAAEFGPLPPAFLPVGNRRLFTHQYSALGSRFERVLMTLPSSFEIGGHDGELLSELGIEVIPVSDALSLPNSIMHAIFEAKLEGNNLAILHGDTLLFDIPHDKPDSVSVATAEDAYHWAGFRLEGGRVCGIVDMPGGGLEPEPVLSGFFNFADLNLLVLTLAASNGDFHSALDRYFSRRPMEVIDDGRWLDFGHLHTYYHSRGSITTERAFNSLAVDGRIVAKRSDRADRIEAEASWYEKMPEELRIFLPHYLGRHQVGGKPGYALEFLFMASLADLFVFGRLPETVWLQVFRSCNQFLRGASSFAAPEDIADDCMQLYLPKTLQRLKEFAESTGLDLERSWLINGIEVPGLAEIARRSAEIITRPTARHLTIIHGDSCLSNIMYDFRSHSVRMIDPRGQDARGDPTIWGDNRYDIAKLHHSIIGLYDVIVAGYCAVDRPAPYEMTFDMPSSAAFKAARSAFYRVFGETHAADFASIEAISLHLFLSMLPLHGDSPSRQWAICANALRLYAEMLPDRIAA